MTITKNCTLWNDNRNIFEIFPVPNQMQYRYTDGLPCITFGISYENEDFKGRDIFTLFDHFYTDLLNEMNKISTCLNGSLRIVDVGADSDGYIDFNMSNGKLLVQGRLGATFSSHSLSFEFTADQTLLTALKGGLTVTA